MGDSDKARLLFSQRFYLTVLAFLGFLVVYVTRVNMSVAILCMVRTKPSHTAALNITFSSQISNRTFLVGRCQEEGSPRAGQAIGDKGEFDWGKQTRSEILAMYFYGYIITQVPSGWLASRYGGKLTWGVGMMVCTLCSVLTPVCARTHVYLVYVIRFLLGAAAGVSFPCLHAMLGKWAPPLERTLLAACSSAGISMGNIIAFSSSGVLCEYGFDNGWGSIFYLAGACNFVWVVAWLIMTSDTPAKHKWISEREKLYIESCIGQGDVKKVRKIPWLKMMTSGPLWALIIGHFCNNYLNYTLLTSMPTFLKETLNFDIKQSGLLSALPYLIQFVGSIAIGFAADLIREKRWMTTKSVRKLFQVTSFLGNAVFISLVGQMDCAFRQVAVALLCFSALFTSFSRAGYVVNNLDLAPSYAGILFGITNTAGTLPGMIAPIIAGALTPNRSADEWRIVFYVCAAVVVFAAVVYFVLAEGELQEWAVPAELKIKMDIVAGHDGDKHKNNQVNSGMDHRISVGSGQHDKAVTVEHKQDIYKF
ncbi:hypothetical protein Btru_039836 [Bulinus truncatus]|nr:hypothetical protein Btru_039836 [Bulinus truncatus]